MHEYIAPNAAVAGLISMRVIDNMPESISARLSPEEINTLILVVQDEALGMLIAAERNKTNKAIIEITAIALAKLGQHPGWRPAHMPKDIAAAIRSGTMPKDYIPYDR